MTGVTYGDLDALKASLNIQLADAVDDDALLAVLDTASRAVEDACGGRRFYATDEVRVYTPVNSCRLLLTDDLLSVSELSIDTTGTREYDAILNDDTDFYLGPPNAAADGRPYWQVLVDERNGSYRFPCRPRSVQISGTFGYSEEPPAPIITATVMLAARLFKRKDAIFGVLGGAEWSEAVRLARTDPDVASLLQPYVRVRLA